MTVLSIPVPIILGLVSFTGLLLWALTFIAHERKLAQKIAQEQENAFRKAGLYRPLRHICMACGKEYETLRSGGFCHSCYDIALVEERKKLKLQSGQDELIERRKEEARLAALPKYDPAEITDQAQRISRKLGQLDLD